MVQPEGFTPYPAQFWMEINSAANISRLIAIIDDPGISTLIATVIAVLAPPPETFRRDRDFAAWLGLVPREHSTPIKHCRVLAL